MSKLLLPNWEILNERWLEAAVGTWKTHTIGSDPLRVGFGDWIPDLFGVLECTGDGPLLPKFGFALKQKRKLKFMQAPSVKQLRIHLLHNSWSFFHLNHHYILKSSHIICIGTHGIQCAYSRYYLFAALKVRYVSMWTSYCNGPNPIDNIYVRISSRELDRENR